MDNDLQKLLIENGYYNLRVIDGLVVGLSDYMFTTGIVVGLTDLSYERRYCYPDRKSAQTALMEWSGQGHPAGNWVKVKGSYQGKYIDEINPFISA